MQAESKKMVVIYVPPATGMTKAHESEMELIQSFGIQVTSWTPPQGDTAPRGLRSAAGEIAYWEEAKSSLLAATRALSVETSACCYVGFNLGGSLAAYFAAHLPVRGLIVAGSVPRLSMFWLRSSHKVALAVRKQAEVVDDSFEDVTRPLDLTSSVSKIAAPLLLQAGRRDEWLEGEPMQELERVRQVVWYDDNHAMVASPTRDARVSFLCNLQR